MSRGTARVGLVGLAGLVILALTVVLAYSAGSGATARPVAAASASALGEPHGFTGHVAYIKAVSRPDFKGCLVFFYPMNEVSFHLIVTDHRLEGLFETALATGHKVQMEAARKYVVPPVIEGLGWTASGVYTTDSVTVLDEP